MFGMCSGVIGVVRQMFVFKLLKSLNKKKAMFGCSDFVRIPNTLRPLRRAGCDRLFGLK